MSLLKVAIVGAGQISQVSHIPNYLKFSDCVEIVGICDPNKELVEKVAKENNIKYYYSSIEEMLDEIKVDAVSICVPNRFHKSTTCYALSKGCHVICEKPPALTVKEAEEMRELADKNNRLLTFNFHFRHAPSIKVLKKKINDGEFGDVYSSRVQAIRRRGIPGWGNFINKEIQGGGPLIDIGIHMLDLAVYLMGYPEIDYVCATTHQKLGKRKGIGLFGDWDHTKFTVEDSAFGFIKFKNGASINLETAFALNIKEKDIRNVNIFGEKAGASIFPFEIYSEDEYHLTNVEYPFGNDQDNHYLSIKNFVFACLKREELIVKADEAVYLQKIINALYESAEEGKPVYLEQI